ncbi:MAG TPA: hypothetical protein VH681_05420 [Nitrospiraceae bacterium]|jgi:hypothetical protein
MTQRNILVVLGSATLLLLFDGYSVFAQSPCLKCVEVAEDELKKCLADAISEDDKTSCAEKQREQVSDCENGECKIERESKAPPAS